MQVGVETGVKGPSGCQGTSEVERFGLEEEIHPFCDDLVGVLGQIC